VIENKSPNISLTKAESQLIKYQSEDNIPSLFYYAQLLLTLNRSKGRYAAVGASAKYWHPWRDSEDEQAVIHELANKSLTADQKKALFSGDFSKALPYFNKMEAAGKRAITEQDQLIYALCRPPRLLDLVRRFTVFEHGERKVARHQQYFAIQASIERVIHFDNQDRRQGGVIWHTQGSGKSLTMVMLARALALEPQIKNPRIVLVSDRKNLDKQIKATFKSCDLQPVRATSGNNLLKLITNQQPLITTLINKFKSASRQQPLADHDPNLFVLVDESHRTQSGKYGDYGKFALAMRRLLPNACYLGFTGTPLLKREKNTLNQFGGLIHQYTIADAVADEAVVPLLYEGRLVEQKLSGQVIDQWFDRISGGLTDQQKADLKRKFTRLNKVNNTRQTLHAKAFDISEHYRRYWQGTGFKAQLVAPGKAAALIFKDILDEIGHVNSEVIISPLDDKEGYEEINAESKDKVQRFWKKMMDRYGNEDQYNEQIIDRFKYNDEPEILIVVNKLLTGFDAPRNTILYLCRSLTEHNLLQAIARVNRLFEENGKTKEFGIIVDYEGLLGELDEALTTYSGLEGCDENDIVGAVHDVREQIKRLPQVHDQLWDVFKSVENKQDMESLEIYLADEEVREIFYEHLRTFGRVLHIALSSEKIYSEFSDQQIQAFMADLKKI
jgi:type I restriction enzyme, R subunit